MTQSTATARTTATRSAAQRTPDGRRLRRRLTVLAFSLSTGLALTAGAFAPAAQASGALVAAGGLPAQHALSPDSSSWS